MKHTYSEYSVLFTHATQSAYRISRNLWTFLLLLPQHSRHSWYTFSKISIVQGHTGMHSSIYPLPSIQPLCLHLLKFSITFGSIVKHSYFWPSCSESIGTCSSLVDSFLFPFYFFLLLNFSHFLLLLFTFHVSNLCILASVFHVSFSKYFQIFIHSCTCSITVVSE